MIKLYCKINCGLAPVITLYHSLNREHDLALLFCSSRPPSVQEMKSLGKKTCIPWGGTFKGETGLVRSHFLTYNFRKTIASRSAKTYIFK